MMMESIEVQQFVWLLVRVKRKQIGAIRTTVAGGEFETYRDRKGRVRKRRKEGTGERVFVPEHILRRAGFEVFLPVEYVWRRRNRFHPEKIRVAKPKLVDWLFVGMPYGGPGWDQLMDLDVVKSVMGASGRPLVMASRDVVKLMRRWGGGMLSPQCHQMAKHHNEYEAGDLVRVDMGAWDGFSAKVVDVEGPTVRVVLQLFGRDVPADFDWSHLSLLSHADR